MRLAIALVAIVSLVAGQSAGKKSAKQTHGEDLSISPGIARVSFDLNKRIGEAINSPDNEYEAQEQVLKAVDEEIEKLLEFDTQTTGDARLIGMLSNGMFMADKYLDDRHAGFANGNSSVAGCLKDVTAAIHDRKFASDGRCKNPFAPQLSSTAAK